ncbi:MAG: hypothetical protein AB1716_01760 [Planctomycetota bacterium]
MNKMAKWSIGFLLAGAVLAGLAAAQEKKGDQEPRARPEPDARLEQFRKLAGEWKGKTNETSAAEQRVQYKVTGAGSAVVETLFPGTPHEMVTVIHYDNDDLLLTHYCAAGNQPRMKAEKLAPAAAGQTAPPKSVKFTFMDGTNMRSPNDAHMHAVTYTFVDPDHVRAEWTFYRDGQPAPEPTVFEFERVKPAGGTAPKQGPPAAGQPAAEKPAEKPAR